MCTRVVSLATFGPVFGLDNSVRRKQKQHFQEDELLVGLFGPQQSFHIKQSRLSKETYSAVIKAPTTASEDDVRGSTAAAEVIRNQLLQLRCLADVNIDFLSESKQSVMSLFHF